ncbi:putative imidazole glycerol phosphate synthase subunit hisF2 [Gammaproteobacteria bacterium]
MTMIRPRIIPCLLLRNNGLVKTVKFKDDIYVGDPINTIKIFNDKEVDELIFLDIDATILGKKPPFKLIEKIASECFMPLCYGGGIRSVEDAKELFNIGVEKISINSLAISDLNLIAKIASIFGNQSVVVSIDVKYSLFNKPKVFSYSNKKTTNLDPEVFAIQAERAGAGELLINSVDRDGKMCGYDLELIGKIANSVSVPVVALGGAGQVEDFRKAIQAGASAVAAGSLFVFHGKHHAVLINYPSDELLNNIFK